MQLPNDIQKIIWKLVFNGVLCDELIPKTQDLFRPFEDGYYVQQSGTARPYDIKIMERTLYYQYIHFNDTSWGLLLGVGKYQVSNADAIQHCK